ncbi:hypothetical protein BDR03DRAFT_968003 [Suillus americanus]|nr:hypothetical protein BDR03DRAFT_968003 [Suillus americanus]
MMPLEPCLSCSNTLAACCIHSSAAALLDTAFEQATTQVGVYLLIDDPSPVVVRPEYVLNGGLSGFGPAPGGGGM